MSEPTEAFGNAVQTYQHLGYTATWLCYTDAGRRVWCIADLTYETTEDVNVGTIIDELANPVTDALFLCLPEPRAMPAKQASLPTIGATRRDLEARLKLDIPPGTPLAGGMSDTATEGNGIYDIAGQSFIWVMSDAEMGDGKLTIFPVEARTSSIDWNFALLPVDMAIDAGIPGLGASSEEVRSTVGPAAAAGGRFSYTGEAPSKTECGFAIYHDVVYEEQGGRDRRLRRRGAQRRLISRQRRVRPAAA